MRKVAFTLAALLAGVVTTVSATTYSGPYRLLDRVLGERLHVHFVNLTLALTFGLVALPLFLVAYAVPLLRPGQPPLLENATQLLRQIAGPPRWLLQLGAAFLVMGIWILYVELPEPELAQISVHDLESGHPPVGSYVELTGGTVDRAARIESVRIGRYTTRFYPLADQAHPPAVFLAMSADDAIPSDRFRGVLRENGMDGELVSQLDAEHAIAHPFYVLGVGQTPNALEGVWIGGAGILLLVWGVVWSRKILKGESAPFPTRLAPGAGPAEAASAAAGTWQCACGKANDEARPKCRRCWAPRPRAATATSRRA
jgi:hypothetical protein